MCASGLPAKLADRDVGDSEPNPQRVVERRIEEGQGRAIEVLDNGPHLLFRSLARGHQLLILSRHRGPQAALPASVGARKFPKTWTHASPARLYAAIRVIFASRLSRFPDSRSAWDGRRRRRGGCRRGGGLRTAEVGDREPAFEMGGRRADAVPCRAGPARPPSEIRDLGAIAQAR